MYINTWDAERYIYCEIKHLRDTGLYTVAKRRTEYSGKKTYGEVGDILKEGTCCRNKKLTDTDSSASCEIYTCELRVNPTPPPPPGPGPWNAQYGLM